MNQCFPSDTCTKVKNYCLSFLSFATMPTLCQVLGDRRGQIIMAAINSLNLPSCMSCMYSLQIIRHVSKHGRLLKCWFGECEKSILTHVVQSAQKSFPFYASVLIWLVFRKSVSLKWLWKCFSLKLSSTQNTFINIYIQICMQYRCLYIDTYTLTHELNAVFVCRSENYH